MDAQFLASIDGAQLIPFKQSLPISHMVGEVINPADINSYQDRASWQFTIPDGLIKPILIGEIKGCRCAFEQISTSPNTWRFQAMGLWIRHKRDSYLDQKQWKEPMIPAGFKIRYGGYRG
ncbi:hypothetical protein ABTG11_10165 [Acinetobacter baumannii]|uniref:hypothetical protein n=1 Tax=Acinetobacter baumannii TaxID=470 RepID=UPI0020CBB4E9|nr:hypothetical protein [Acinetobacter baumannii]MCQ1048997.1 hypothetical protein [Acinetobacter baumannii]MCQ1098269.1 hypothetical protein [Acinetobacter baumannii]MDA3537078.1 hypothetical protein [Acinetobacter baumannii]MDA3592460.1 hypothetical protein [Acinetobacter baumannii]MDA3594465.1 hypothetical protein [Acinetobacter baumannii]